MSWFYFALATAVGSAAYNLVGRIMAVKSTDGRVFSVLFNMIACVFAVFFFLIEPFKFRGITVTVVLVTILSTVLMAVFERLQFVARKEIDASSLSIIFRLVPAVSVIASIIFLRESITLYKVVAVLLIVGGNLLVAITKGKGKLAIDRPTLIALVAATALGLAWTADKRAQIGYSASLYALIAWVLPTIYNFLTPPISVKELKHEWKNAGWGLVVLAGLNVLTYYLQI